MGNENLFFKLENVICIFIQDKVKSSWCLNICLICLFAHQGSSNYVSFIMKLRIARPYGIFMKEKYPCLSLKVFLNTPMPTWFLMSQAFGRPILGEDRNILCIINIFALFVKISIVSFGWHFHIYGHTSVTVSYICTKRRDSENSQWPRSCPGAKDSLSSEQKEKWYSIKQLREVPFWAFLQRRFSSCFSFLLVFFFWGSLAKRQWGMRTSHGCRHYRRKYQFILLLLVLFWIIQNHVV